MALQIQSTPSQPGETAKQLSRAISEAIPDARVDVQDRGPGHFEIRVVSKAFDGLSRVRQQQLVYGAIAHLMKGDAAPVHAIDRLQTELP